MRMRSKRSLVARVIIWYWNCDWTAASVSLRRSTLLSLAPTGVSVAVSVGGERAVGEIARGDRGAQAALEVDAARAVVRGVDVRDVVSDDPLTQGDAVEGGSEDRADRIGQVERHARPPRKTRWVAVPSAGWSDPCSEELIGGVVAGLEEIWTKKGPKLLGGPVRSGDDVEVDRERPGGPGGPVHAVREVVLATDRAEQRGHRDPDPALPLAQRHGAVAQVGGDRPVELGLVPGVRGRPARVLEPSLGEDDVELEPVERGRPVQVVCESSFRTCTVMLRRLVRAGSRRRRARCRAASSTSARQNSVTFRSLPMLAFTSSWCR